MALLGYASWPPPPGALGTLWPASVPLGTGFTLVDPGTGLTATISADVTGVLSIVDEAGTILASGTSSSVSIAALEGNAARVAARFTPTVGSRRMQLSLTGTEPLGEQLLTVAQANAAFVALAGAANLASLVGPLIGFSQDSNGQHFEIRKTGSPLDYSADTHAAFVVQHKDTQNLGNGMLVPAAVFDFTKNADGYVVPASHYSNSIWQGVFAVMRNTGDGSAHSFTATGELRNVGASGYNELGGFQGELTNFSSTNGTLSGVELLLKDSPDAGTTSFDCQSTALTGRIAKYNPGRTRRTVAFFASSEGSVAPDAVMGVKGSVASPSPWNTGIDFSGASFGTGVAMQVPNNTNLSWNDASGVAQPILFVSATNETQLRPASAAASVKLGNFAGTRFTSVGGTTGELIVDTTSGDLFEARSAGAAKFTVLSDGELKFTAGITTAAVGAAGGAAAMPTPDGYLYFFIGGTQKRLAYFQ